MDVNEVIWTQKDLGRNPEGLQDLEVRLKKPRHQRNLRKNDPSGKKKKKKEDVVMEAKIGVC